MIAVFFDIKATVFDEAPFELTARTPNLVAPLYAHLSGKYKLKEEIPTELTNYLSPASVGIYAKRESNVTNYYLRGDILEYFRAIIPTICGEGQDHMVDIEAQTASGSDLHLMPLFTDTFFRAI